MSAWIVGCVFAVFGFTLLVLIKVYVVLTLGKCHSKRRLDGMTALITGASRGIGYYTALKLLKQGCRVLITSENPTELASARSKLIKESEARAEDVVAIELQLLDFSAVRKVASNIIATESRLDILVNNAGTAGLGGKYTKDGILPGLQVNYFGAFLFTHLLLGLLKKTPNSRIVNVSSTFANIFLGFDVDNITSVRSVPLGYEWSVYCNSKIMVAAFTMALAERLRGTGVTVNCLHPGAVNTQIFQMSRLALANFTRDVFAPLCFKSPAEGAETSIHLAMCEHAEGVTGKYFSDCRESSLYGSWNFTKEAQEKIWKQSIQVVKLQPHEMFV